MNFFTKYTGGNNRVWAALILFLLVAVAPAAAQKNKDKNKSKDAPISDSTVDTSSLLTDSQLIDRTVSEALGYWQIGDIDSMHKYYANDVLVVSGAWEPPVVGWDNYVKAYQAQRAHLTSARLDRTNTYIKSSGNSAWATYQWKYTGSMDGKLFDSRGHTTLILNKQGDHWVIAVDHSSAVSENVMDGPAPSAVPAQPGQP